MTVMTSASVLRTGMSFLMPVVMIAVCRSILRQISRQQCGNRFVCIPADSGIQFNTSLCQSHLRTGPDAAAEQNPDTAFLQETGQRAVSLSLRTQTSSLMI